MGWDSTECDISQENCDSLEGALQNPAQLAPNRTETTISEAQDGELALLLSLWSNLPHMARRQILEMAVLATTAKSNVAPVS